MNWLIAAWSWLSDESHQKMLGFIGGGVAVFLGAAWQVYVYWSDKKDTSKASQPIGKSLDPDHPDVAASLNNLAVLYRAQGAYAQAEPLLQRALAVWEKALGPDHPDVAASLNNLAELYKAQGQYVEAEPLYQRSLAIREKALGSEYSKGVLENYADLLRRMNRLADAENVEARVRKIGSYEIGSYER